MNSEFRGGLNARPQVPPHRATPSPTCPCTSTATDAPGPPSCAAAKRGKSSSSRRGRVWVPPTATSTHARPSDQITFDQTYGERGWRQCRSGEHGLRTRQECGTELDNTGHVVHRTADDVQDLQATPPRSKLSSSCAARIERPRVEPQGVLRGPAACTPRICHRSRRRRDAGRDVPPPTSRAGAPRETLRRHRGAPTRLPMDRAESPAGGVNSATKQSCCSRSARRRSTSSSFTSPE